MTDRLGRLAQEAIVLILVVASPWAFGANEPVFEWAILTGTAAILVLWAVRLIAARRTAWRLGPVGIALGGLFLFTALQLAPLNSTVHAALSPGTLRLRQELMPATPEVFAGEAEPLVATPDSRFPISLYPHATRQFLIQILVVFLLFAAVRNQVAGPHAFRRLAWACWANGALLSVFALAQALSSRSDTVYWSVRTEGAVFGPFICRNHFPFYIHMCLGLSLGLLQTDHWLPQRRMRSLREIRSHDSVGWAAALLQDPWNLWVVGGIGLMAVASVYSLSRGGVLALAGGALACLAARWRLTGRTLSWSSVGIAGTAVVVTVVAWIGAGRVTDRMETLGERERLRESRLELWENLARQVPHFPIVGTGAGTVSLVEPMGRRQPLRGEFFAQEFAHNEYLEALLEGGVVRAALTLLLAAAVLGMCWRALKAAPDGAAFGFALGGTFGLVTVVLHSAFDFGLHLPAVAILAAVLAAQMTHAAATPMETVVPPRSVLVYPAALILVALTVALVGEGWTNDRVERLRLTARAMSRSDDAAERERAFEFWDAALALRPHDALLHQSSGQAHLNAAADGRNRDKHFRAGVQQLVETRDLCPLLAHPHVRLAENRDRLACGDSAVIYLQRAARLLPSDPEIWYILGRAHFSAGESEQAMAAWRTCLEKSANRLPDILRLAVPSLSSSDILERLLPPDSDQIMAAAEMLFPRDSDRARRRPFLERALSVQEQAGTATADDWRRRAELQLSLDRPEQALQSYRAAVALAPRRTELRLEYAKQLRRQGQLAAARSELETVLRQDPERTAARDLLAVVERELILKDELK